MLHKHLIFAAAAIPVIVGAVILCGCHPRLAHHYFHGSHGKAADWMFKKISKELSLNQDQKKQLTRIKDEILAKHEELKTPHEEMFNTILAEMAKDTVDQKKLNRLFEEKHKQMEELRPFLISKLSEFHSMLTPEQRIRLAEKMKKFHQKQCN